jgi:HSP20 family protein
MAIRDLIPWGRNGQSQQLAREGDYNPFLTLHRDMNRLFDEAFRSFETMGFGMPAQWSGGSVSNWPSISVSDAESEVRVTAEVPGLEEKDMEVLLENDMLVLRGEKRSEATDEGRHFSERFYGRFERRIPLGYEIDQDKVVAQFKNGVLTVTLPKSAEAQSKARRIQISNVH